MYLEFGLTTGVDSMETSIGGMQMTLRCGLFAGLSAAHKRSRRIFGSGRLLRFLRGLRFPGEG